MVNGARTRKRVHAIRRGPDGSAFQQCENCGVSVAIALADMHDCESNNKVKKFRGEEGDRCRGRGTPKILNFEDQPRSAYLFFMEEFAKECEEEDEIAIDRKGFEMWKKMSPEEREQYIMKAEKVDLSYIKALQEEQNSISWVDDEADSAASGNYDKKYGKEEYSEGFLFWSGAGDSCDSTYWGKRILDQVKK